MRETVVCDCVVVSRHSRRNLRTTYFRAGPAVKAPTPGSPADLNKDVTRKGAMAAPVFNWMKNNVVYTGDKRDEVSLNTFIEHLATDPAASIWLKEKTGGHQAQVTMALNLIARNHNGHEDNKPREGIYRRFKIVMDYVPDSDDEKGEMAAALEDKDKTIAKMMAEMERLKLAIKEMTGEGKKMEA